MSNEMLIKNKSRVRNHGEVFTPKQIVNDMIEMEGLNDVVSDIKTTVLEPSVGEGIFLIEILKRRLCDIRKFSNGDINFYENMSLLALSTLYGIELLEDNAQKCVINIYECFFENYLSFVNSLSVKIKKNVLSSAKTIIATNIVQGNFLTKLTTEGEDIVFSEWRVVGNIKKGKNIYVFRTEHSIENIKNEVCNEDGYIFDTKQPKQNLQLNLFETIDYFSVEKKYKYVKSKITDVYKEEMEEL